MALEIEYLRPLRSAWRRMGKILFSPFDAVKWMVIGFSAWLAYFCEGNRGGFINFFPNLGGNENIGKIPGINKIEAIPLFVKGFFRGRELLSILIVSGAVFLVSFLAVALLISWIKSRGEFIFFDNITNNKAEIVRPWKKYRIQGNSLFFWKVIYFFVFSCALVLLMLPIAGLSFLLCWPSIKAGTFQPMAIVGIVIGIIGIALLLLLVGLVSSIVQTFLRHFIVPLMHKKSGRIMDAWREFIVLLRKYPADFFLYLLFLFGLNVGFVVVYMTVMVCTCCLCCIGGIILAIPYIGTVILLPVPVFFRLFSAEFLSQFGGNYDVFPEKNILKPENSRGVLTLPDNQPPNC